MKPVEAKDLLFGENSISKALSLEEEQLFGVFRRQQGDRAMTQVENKEKECQGPRPWKSRALITEGPG